MTGKGHKSPSFLSLSWVAGLHTAAHAASPGIYLKKVHQPAFSNTLTFSLIVTVYTEITAAGHTLHHTKQQIKLIFLPQVFPKHHTLDDYW